METTCTTLIGPGLIDSIIKLRVLLVFLWHPVLRGGAASLGQRLPGDHRALEEALDALTDAGLLERRRAGGHCEYELARREELRRQLDQFATCFDDPQRRDEFFALVRAAEQERTFRDALAGKWRALGGQDAYEAPGV